MAEIANVPTQIARGQRLETWTALANGDTGRWIDVGAYGGLLAEGTGTFGAGGTLALEGTNDLADPPAAASILPLGTLTSAGWLTFGVGAYRVRPNVTAGDGTTTLTIRLRLVALGHEALTPLLLTTTEFLRLGEDLLTITDQGGAPQLVIETTPNAVNYWRLQGAATGVAPTFVVDGDDADISTGWYAKGVGEHFFGNDKGVQFGVEDEGSGSSVVNYLSAVGGISGANPTLKSTRGIILNVAASQALFFNVNGVTMFAARNVASLGATDCYPVLSGDTTTGRLNVEGADANIGWFIQSKGAAGFSIWNGGGPLLVLSGSAVATPVNSILITPSVTTNPVILGAQGSDTNIDLSLTPKGSGVLRFGTHSALAAETVTGYITIKDAVGTSRKIAVVS